MWEPRGVRHRWLLVAAGTALAARAWCGGRAPARPLRMATFNIESYPRTPAQERGAFAAIRATGAAVVAVQEIIEPDRFRAAARRELGVRWDAVFADDDAGALHHVGLAYDGAALTLDWARTDPATAIYPGARATLEARLLSHGHRPLRVFVIHLRAGGDGGPVRARQLAALEPSIERARVEGDDVVVLGDFNATGTGDREAIAGLALSTELTWASHGLGCTAYWDRRDGCHGVALDHVLTPRKPHHITVADPCHTHGCGPHDGCPTFVHEVSDHCPVVLDLR